MTTLDYATWRTLNCQTPETDVDLLERVVFPHNALKMSFHSPDLIWNGSETFGTIILGNLTRSLSFKLGLDSTTFSVTGDKLRVTLVAARCAPTR